MTDREKGSMKMFEGEPIIEFVTKEFYEWLQVQGFFTAPASTKYHGDYDGGLFAHSFKVMKTLEDWTLHLGIEWRNHRSPYVVGMFHDLCKIDAYTKDYTTGVYSHRNGLLLTGHAEKSIALLSQFMQLTEEEVICIRYHMGAYEKEDWEGYDFAIRKYPTVLLTHTADMWASKVMGD